MSDPLFKRSEKALFANVGDDIVALHLENGFCFGMAEVSAQVWDLLGETVGLDQICDRLMQQYEVDAGTCRAEVGKLLGELVDQGLVETVPRPAGGA